MSVRELALDWSVDGPLGILFAALVAVVGGLYVSASVIGRRRDRRARAWPRQRTACFLGGLAALIVVLYSGIGTQADARLSVHMVEHMVLWVIVAPLLVAGAPVRLALFALPRRGRRALAAALHRRAPYTLVHPVVAVVLFDAVLLITHIPGVYGLALANDYVHEGEHALYLLTATLMWAPLLGTDPLPHRIGRRGACACMVAGMVPMVVIAAWLAGAGTPVYGHYLTAAGASALADQHLAATIMWAGGLPALAVPLIGRRRGTRPAFRVRAAA